MNDAYPFLPRGSFLSRLTAAERLFLFGIKKKQKMPAENFSLEVSGVAGAAESEKFVRPDLSGTGILCLWPSWVEMYSGTNILLGGNCKIRSR